MTSVVTTTRFALTWRTNVLRCLIQCVQKLMQTLLRMLNTSSTTSKRHGTITMKTQRSRSVIFQSIMSRLRSKETGNYYLFHVSSTPILNPFFSCASKFMIFSVLPSWPDSFSFIGMTVGFTHWNTLQSGKVDGSLSSQLQWSLSFAKYTHGTGWWLKISTRRPTHESS